jgi:hypothetical protein
VNPTDEKFLKYKCPIFIRYVICASGFDKETKSHIKDLVESNGGTYNGELLCGITTHLIVNEPSGAKFESSELWKIGLVNSEWLYVSVKASHFLREKDGSFETSKNIDRC